MGKKCSRYEKTDAQVNTVAKQSGITLVVVMVILVVMTFLGLGAMQDSNLQVSMVRNTQLQNHLYNLSLGEINAQIDTINNGTQDVLVLDLVRANLAANQTIDVVQTRPELIGLGAILGSTVDAASSDRIQQQLTLGTARTGLSRNNSLNGSQIRIQGMELTSEVSISGTSQRSSQSQGLQYYLPNPGNGQ